LELLNFILNVSSWDVETIPLGKKLTPWIVTPRKEVRNSRGLFSSLDMKQSRGDVLEVSSIASTCRMVWRKEHRVRSQNHCKRS